MGILGLIRKVKKERPLPDGWDVREPCFGVGYFRICCRGEVIDGRPTRELAVARAWRIIENRDRAARAPWNRWRGSF